MSEQNSVTPFAECPNCGKLLEVDTTQCPECREPITETYSILSAVSNVLNTRACNLAKEIENYNRIMVLVAVGESVPLYLLDRWVFGYPVLFWLALIPSAIALFLAVVWYVEFGRFPLGDANYVKAKSTVKHSATLWAAISILQIAALIGSRH